VDIQQRLEALRRLQYLLDNAFRIPGTNLRFGWDPIVGLVPWLGDVLTALYSLTLLVNAHQLRVPRLIQIRMLVNTAIDVLVGLIPVVGDVSDVFWKSNAKNFALLERHAGGLTRPSRGDWLFVTGIIGAVLATALTPVALMFWLITLVTSR
jgi:hypothetical protein